MDQEEISETLLENVLMFGEVKIETNNNWLGGIAIMDTIKPGSWASRVKIIQDNRWATELNSKLKPKWVEIELFSGMNTLDQTNSDLE